MGIIVEGNNSDISNIDLTNCTKEGLYVEGVNVTINAVNANDCAGNAIELEVNNATISNIAIGDINGTAIAMEGYDNKLSGITLNGGNGEGVDVEGDRNTVNDVMSNDFVGTAVSIDGDNNTVSKVDVNGGKGTVVDILGGNSNAVSGITAKNHAGELVKDNGTNTKQSKISPGEANKVITVKGNVKNPVFTITLPKDATGNFSVKINGKTYKVAVKNGAGTITVTGLLGGSYSAVASYTGSAKYSTVSKTTTVKVPAVSTVLKAAKKKYTFKKSQRSKTKTFKFTLLYGKKKVSGVKVYLKLDKKALKKIKAKSKKVKKYSINLKKVPMLLKPKKVLQN